MDPGTKLGPYEILEPLGAGGMGEVYLAEDARLGRRVALKVLPAQFARDPERLARFEQEAKVLAALNHPNIAQVFGLEHAEAPVIVMELVDGEDLSQLLAGRPLPLDEVLPIARQIAKALGAAHEAGIVHRDLKPANILVRPDGVVKVLDFGLAKTVVGASGSGSGLADSPTIMSPVMTATGMIMGTAAYMAPEQAKGRPVDRRADVWAFGCVLYEMLVGRRPFGGDDVAEVMASVIKDAADLDALPDDTPAPIRRLLARCLKKDPADRLDSMAAVRLEIEDAEIAAPFQTGRAMASRNRPLPLLGAAGAGLVVGALLWSVLSPEFVLMNNLPDNASDAGEVVRLSIPLGADGPIALGGQPPVAVAISPDGAQIVYVVTEAGENVLYLRRLDEPEARPIPGTERGHGPFFSPDGEWLGFFADGKLKTISLAGGAPVELAGAATARGATVTADGRIIFTPTINSGLWAVSISGGEPQELTQFDAEAGEFGHRWPHALPDGNTVLFVIDRGGSFDEARIGLLSLDTGETREIIDGGTCPVYLPTGHVVYARGGALLAVLFDLETGEILGRPTVVLTDVATQQDTGAGHFALSATGILVYIPGGAQTNERVIVNIDFDGAVAPIANLPARAYQQPSLAPDGTRLAVNIVEGTHDIWIAELGRGALTRLTFRGDNHSPLWSPDGQKVAFGSERGGPLSLFWIAADGSAEEEELLTGENSLVPNSWSPDGKLLAYTEIHPSTRGDVWVLSMDGERTAQAFLASEQHEREAAFSPDGTLLAYVSDEAGRDGVYVQPYPGPGRKLQISTEGGNQPVWSPDGGTLYYRNGDRMMAVRVNAETLSAEAPRQLFEERLDEGYIYNPRIYDVTIDGSGFIAVKREGDSSVTQVNVVLNWFEELKQRVPTGR